MRRWRKKEGQEKGLSGVAVLPEQSSAEAGGLGAVNLTASGSGSRLKHTTIDDGFDGQVEMRWDGGR